jgi:hypothetical protein
MYKAWVNKIHERETTFDSGAVGVGLDSDGNIRIEMAPASQSKVYSVCGEVIVDADGVISAGDARLAAHFAARLREVADKLETPAG